MEIGEHKASDYRRCLALWFKWVVVNAIGGVIGNFTATMVMVAVYVVLTAIRIAAMGTVSQLLICVGTLGLWWTIGVAQARVLKPYLADTAAWAAASAIGGALGMSMGLFILLSSPANEPIPLVVSGLAGAIAGCVVGIAQMTVVSSELALGAGWWIVANTMAGITGWIGWNVAYSGVAAIGFRASMPQVLLGTGWAVGAAITGFVLIGVLRPARAG